MLWKSKMKQLTNYLRVNLTNLLARDSKEAFMHEYVRLDVDGYDMKEFEFTYDYVFKKIYGGEEE